MKRRHQRWRKLGRRDLEEGCDLVRGPKAVADGLFAGASPTYENGFKLTLVQRPLDAVLTEAKGCS